MELGEKTRSLELSIASHQRALDGAQYLTKMLGEQIVRETFLVSLLLGLQESCLMTSEEERNHQGPMFCVLVDGARVDVDEFVCDETISPHRRVKLEEARTNAACNDCGKPMLSIEHTTVVTDKPMSTTVRHLLFCIDCLAWHHPPEQPANEERQDPRAGL